MKKLSKIKLNQFNKDELNQRKMNALKGGCCSTCNNVDACTGASPVVGGPVPLANSVAY